SLLSLILFIFYITSLYKALNKKYLYLSIVKFIDDINLLAFSKKLKVDTY
ncbi:hypothetical protein QBC46DRAFT_273087, partial [Diplogelasinospora grovesii]